jgi:succinoglycan biosynthesis transport protein ExoP
MIGSQASAEGRRTGIREALRFINQHKMIILAPTVLIGGVAWMIAVATPPLYTAYAALALDVRKVQVVEKEVVPRLSQEGSAIRTELDVMSSSSLNEPVVDRLNLTADPDVLRDAGAVHSVPEDIAKLIKQIPGRFFPDIAAPATNDDKIPNLTRSQLTGWLVGNLKVSNDGKSFTVRVSFTAKNPLVAARMANAIAENYLDDQVQTKAAETKKASEWLGRQLIKIRQELEASEAAVDDYRRESGLLQVKGATIPAERLGDLNTQLSDARTERMKAEVKLQTARESGPETLPEFVASPTIQALRKELTQINSDFIENRDHSTFYKLNVLESRAAALRKQMNQEMNRILASLASELQVARKREGELEQSFKEMEAKLGAAAHSGVGLVQLQREADANRSIYETFLARYKQTMEQQSLAAPDARLISKAEPPGAPIYPNMSRFLLIGAFGGLALGGALAFLREGFDRRIRHASGVETVTGIPVLGFLPKVSRWRGLQPQDYPISDPHSRFCVALARIRTALRAPNSSDLKQIILVTSAQPGDGKTSFCTGLARSLAKSRMRVLVIDADPYRSRVATAFGASTVPAAMDPISDRPARLGDIVQTDTQSTAQFIAAPSPDDLQFLLHTGQFTKLLDEARQAYDIVIIDTPPVMTSADAAVIGRFADVLLFVARCGWTSWDEMTAAIGFLRLCRIRLDGIVMMGVDHGSSRYGQLAGYDTMPSDYQLTRPPSDQKLTQME